MLACHLREKAKNVIPCTRHHPPKGSQRHALYLSTNACVSSYNGSVCATIYASKRMTHNDATKMILLFVERVNSPSVSWENICQLCICVVALASPDMCLCDSCTVSHNCRLQRIRVCIFSTMGRQTDPSSRSRTRRCELSLGLCVL